MTTFELGSQTAKGGFANEKAICAKFNNWREDNEAQLWLKIMGYDIRQIDSVEAIHIPARLRKADIERFGLREDFGELMRFKKADAQVRVKIVIGDIVKIENLSLKRVTIKKNKPTSGFNQIDKRWVDSYQQIWNFDDDIAYGLRLYTGQTKPPKEIISTQRLKDDRRLYLDEMPGHLKNKIVDFFKNNKILVVTDIFKGRGGLSANWMLVTRYDETQDTTTWTLRDINTVMNFFGGGEVIVSKNGCLHIGRITMQRKGGTPDPTKLQFKIKPCELFRLK